MSTLYSYFQHWFNVLQTIEEKLDQFSKSDQYIIWGAGLHTEFLFNKTFFSEKKDAKFLFLILTLQKLVKHIESTDSFPFCQISNYSCWHAHHSFLLCRYWKNEKRMYKRGWSKDNILSFYDHFRLY